MEDVHKTKKQLIEELNKLRQSLAELKGFDINEHKGSDTDLRKAYERLEAADEQMQAQYNSLVESEQSLRESEERFKTLFEKSVDAQVLLDHEGKVADCNAAFIELFGLRGISEVIGHTPVDFAPEFQLDGTPSSEIGRKIRMAILEKGSARFEWLHQKHDPAHTPILTELSCTIITVANQPMIHAVIRDITARKKAEENISILADLIEISPVSIMVHDLQGNLLYANQKTFDLHGYSKDEFLALNLHEIDAPASEVLIEARIKEILQTGEAKFEVEHYRKDGTIFPLEVFVKATEWEGKKVLLSFASDITERKRAAEALRESEEKYRYITERMSDVIWTLKSNFEVQYVSPSVLKALGFTPEERIKQTIFERITPESFKKVEEILELEMQRERKGGVDPDRTVTLELEYYHKDGSAVWHETVVSGIRDVEGNIVGFHGASRDITKRKKIEKERTILEERLRRAEKLESIGTLAGGIAHDFNNILSAIMGYTEIAIQGLDKSNPVRRYLDQVFTAAGRARDLVKQILAFSRQSEERPRPLRVAPIIKELLKLLRASLPTTIKIREDVQPESDTILGDPTQIHQILMNLCTNAAHAMQGEKGELKISLAPVNVEPPDNLITHHDLSPGKYLRLTVSDTGIGIDNAIVDRIFDPFFTTKKPGEGTGLGLSVVYGIVKSYGGVITVQSEVGKGTEFKVYLPLLTLVEAKQEEKVDEPIPRGNERILFVDDEAALVQLATSILSPLGYEVVGRTSSLDALELFRARPDRFDLVITDMTMPNMTGSELALQLMLIRPDIPVILCTGFSEAITQEKARALGVKEFIMKPIVQQQIAEAIRRVLDKKE